MGLKIFLSLKWFWGAWVILGGKNNKEKCESEYSYHQLKDIKSAYIS